MIDIPTGIIELLKKFDWWHDILIIISASSSLFIISCLIRFIILVVFMVFFKLPFNEAFDRSIKFTSFIGK